jgi:hypothetical protein
MGTSYFPTPPIFGRVAQHSPSLMALDSPLAFIMTFWWSQALACEYSEAPFRKCSLNSPVELAGRYREWNRTQYCFAI